MPHNFTSIVLRAEGGTRPLLAPLCFTPFKRKSMRKQGHASQSRTPGRRAVSQTMILTRHPATDRSQPPRTGGLLCVLSALRRGLPSPK